MLLLLVVACFAHLAAAHRGLLQKERARPFFNAAGPRPRERARPTSPDIAFGRWVGALWSFPPPPPAANATEGRAFQALRPTPGHGQQARKALRRGLMRRDPPGSLARPIPPPDSANIRAAMGGKLSDHAKDQSMSEADFARMIDTDADFGWE